MKRFLFATLLCAVGHCALGADTDADGLLDLIDVPGFNPNASGEVDYCCRGIEDLEGANLLTNAQDLTLLVNQITGLETGDFQGLSNLQSLDLGGNRITSLENGDFEGLVNLQTIELWENQITNLESGDFQGLGNLQRLSLWRNQITNLENGAFQGLSNLQDLNLSSNQITTIENGAFQGLSNLQSLNLRDNNITELNLTNATFASLLGRLRCWFCVDSTEIVDLILDDALLSQSSFQVIVSQTQYISNVSLVGLAFSDGNPANLSALLDISTLDNVRVDQALFDRYAAEFNAFDTIPGNTVTVVPEPAALSLCTAASVLAWLFHRPRRWGRSCSSKCTSMRHCLRLFDKSKEHQRAR